MEQCNELLNEIINDNTNTKYNIKISHKCYDYLKTNLPKNIIFEEKDVKLELYEIGHALFLDMKYAEIHKLQPKPNIKYIRKV
jgi:hypothetical protein